MLPISNHSTITPFDNCSNSSKSWTAGIGRHMESKPCSRCSQPADFSLALLLSTIRVRPRAQKCSKTIALCNCCLHSVLASLGTSPLADLQQPLISAYTKIAGPYSFALNRQSQDSANAEPHQGGRAAGSSRPCLIAGNSRKFTQTASQGETERESQS